MTAAAMSAILSPEIVVAGTGARPASPARLRPEPLAGVSIDTRTLEPGELFVAIAGPRFDGHAFLAEAAARGAAGAVVHRDVEAPADFPLLRVADTTQALGRLARRVRDAARIPIVCVTGSAGKTTTKDMIAALLAPGGPVLKTEGNLNNQYGLPLTLLRLASEHKAAVLELGMSAPGELRRLADIARPDVAVITNVAPVHLEFFESVDDIARAKAEILEGLPPSGTAVLNRDDARVRRIGEGRSGRVVWFGRDAGSDVHAQHWSATADGMLFGLVVSGRPFEVALPLPGLHNMMNFLAAAAAAHALGVPPEALPAAAHALRAAPHRGEVARLGQGVTLLDDCYNSNPVAVEAALGALQVTPHERRVAFLGDMLELGPSGPELHRQVGERMSELADVVVAVGPLAVEFLKGARAGGFPEEALLHFADAAAAALASGAIVRPRDAVLVKGSRGVRMESIVEALRTRFGRVE
jgi:UDP-N-acetylmuramoyl-tripeptide--D-alanyl-D-alanine ligase